ncbi:MAG: tetratricopeptide repeat protein, partial [Nitrospinota bacterium]
FPSGGAPLFHLAGLFVHSLNVLLVYRILGLLVTERVKTLNKGNLFPAGAGALLFAIHPLQVEAVCWVTGMKDLLSAFFSLLALWQFGLFLHLSDQAVSSKLGFFKRMVLPFTSFHYLAATLSFFAALISKPNAVVLPGIAFLLSKMIQIKGKSVFSSVFPWGVLSIPFIFITKSLQPDSDLPFVTPILFRPVIASDAVTFYTLKILFPFNLGMDYGRTPEFVLQQNWVIFSSLVPLLLLWLAWKSEKERKYFVAALIFIAGMLPVSGLVPFAFQFFSTVADRYIYLAMLGPAIAVSFFLRGRKKARLILSLFLLLCLPLLSSGQAQNWKNDVELFAHASDVNSLSSFARYNLGVTYTGLKEYEKAEKSFLDALKVQPGFPDALNNLGEVYLKQGNASGAEKVFKRLLRRHPDFEKGLNNMGVALQRQGRGVEALPYFRKAVAVKPDYAKAHNNLGVLLVSSGDTEGALYHFKQALKYKPDYINALNNLNLLLSMKEKKR